MKFPLRLAAALALAVATARLGVATPLPGQLVVDPDHPQSLLRHGGGHVVICGPGDPENFLYRGARNADGTRRGDQVELIEKLARHGGNSIYLEAVRTHGGDAKGDKTQNPFVDSDPGKALDARILDQWEQWFTLMDRHEILIYFLFYDDSARIWDTGDAVGTLERQFFETIVRRFRHHQNLIWIVGEEVDERYTAARVRALAAVIRGADDHGHIIGAHHLAGTVFRAWEPGSALTHFSMQLNLHPESVHAGALEARAKAADRYQVFYAENTMTPKDDDSLRRHVWAVAMAGLNPLILQMNIAETSTAALSQCRSLQRFLEASDYYRMSPRDELADRAARHVLADAGRSYLVYSETAGAIGVRSLPAGRCAITWLDCRTGQTAEEEQRFSTEGDRGFNRPRQIGAECAAWLRYPEIAPAAPRPRQPTAAPPGLSKANHAPQVEDREVRTRRGVAVGVQLRFVDEDGPGPYSYAVVDAPKHGRISGTDNDRIYTPAADFVGTDSFTWQVNDGVAPSATARITVRVED